MSGSRPVRVELGPVEGAFHVGDGRQRLVVDAHLVGGAARLLRMLGGNEHDRLAEVAHAVDREHRLIAELEPVALLARNVRVRENRVHAGHRHRLGNVDRRDARMSMRAAHGVAPEHPGCAEVARERKLALDLRDAVGAKDCVADTAEFELARRRGRRHCGRRR